MHSNYCPSTTGEGGFHLSAKKFPFEADIDLYRKPHLVNKQRRKVMGCLVPLDTSETQPPKLLSQKREWEDCKSQTSRVSTALSFHHVDSGD